MQESNSPQSVTESNQVVDLLADRRTNMLDQMSQLQRFTGADPYYPVDRFRKDFQELAEWFKWGEDEQLFILKKRLGGKAAEIYDIYEGSIKTPQNLFKKLEERLGKDVASADKFRILRDFVQTPEMPVEDFITIARKKALAAAKAHKSLSGEKINEVAEEWLLNMLFENILPQYRREILRANPKTSQQFEEIAILEEKAYLKTKSNTPVDHLVCATVHPEKEDKFVNLMSEMTIQMQNLASKVEKLEKERKIEENKFENNNIVCYNCQERGHIARYCPKFERNTRMNNFRGRGSNHNNNFRGNYQQNRYRSENQYGENQQHQTRGFYRGFYRGNNRGRGNGGNNSVNLN